MKRTMYSLVLAFVCGVVLMGTSKLLAADEPAKVAGTWEKTSESRSGPMTQTMTITQDGGSSKGTLTGRRGDAPLEGTVTGNKLSFTVKRETQSGDTLVMEYTGTVEGDIIKGNVHSERFGNREFTAKRTK